MNAAQKAWETRRAKAAGREAIALRAAQASEPVKPSPLRDARMVELWLDRQDVGCGLRRYVVLSIGDRSVTLFSASKLIAVEVDRRSFDEHALPVKCMGTTVARIIRENVALADRVNDRAGAVVLNDGGAAAQRALVVLS